MPWLDILLVSLMIGFSACATLRYLYRLTQPPANPVAPGCAGCTAACKLKDIQMEVRGVSSLNP